MVKLRLQRRGRKKLPFYKIVVADSRAPRDGRFIEAIGEYNPLPQQAHVVLNRERALYWLEVGAQPTDTVRNILTGEGIILHRHLVRKGKEEAEIEEELAKWSEARTERLAKARNKKQIRAAKKKAEKAAAETEKSDAAPAEESAPAAEEKPASE